MELYFSGLLGAYHKRVEGFLLSIHSWFVVYNLLQTWIKESPLFILLWRLRVFQRRAGSVKRILAIMSRTKINCEQHYGTSSLPENSKWSSWSLFSSLLLYCHYHRLTLFYGMLLAEERGDVIWCNTSLLSPLGHMPSSNSLSVKNKHSVPHFSHLGLVDVTHIFIKAR